MKVGLPWAIVAYLLAAAAFELVLALRHAISPEGGGWAVPLVALLAMLAGTGLVLRGAGPAGALIAPAAALFVTAYFYTGDPYYRPDFRSYGDGGIFSPTWIFVLLGLALGAGLTTRLWPRKASVESAVVLVLLIFTTLFMGTGH